ncbi:plasmid mobilization protein [Cuniculiplasma divulgatum]|jgi:hypothetical protein|uniref:Uncharacterized protein n=1 Tax=Cuniculiplasma divulgatum TaxID=1673428 RepID=A0A1N5TNB6_9ARCH|nr:MAG: hypothetical protein B2I18_05480 [Cuniculiplasma sp. C_DKE]SIM49990.1 hypothetical protein CSP5_0637 [Cuniculiplasma divulgatum]SJK84486.1 hypothetical protein CPM_0615 [Cuniculiplasma divulgatum]
MAFSGGLLEILIRIYSKDIILSFLKCNKPYNVLSINIIVLNSTKYNKISVYIRKEEKAIIEEKALLEGVSISRYLVLAALHNDLNFEKSK